MKKKVLLILLMVVFVISLTGCGSKSTTSEKDNEYNNTEEQEIINDKEKKEYKTYYCDQDEDDDFEFYLYYENDKLVKITSTSIYADDEDYAEAKENLKDYEGVTLTRKNQKLYLEVDLENGGMTYFDEYTNISDTSYENIIKTMKQDGFSCSLIEE